LTHAFGLHRWFPLLVSVRDWTKQFYGVKAARPVAWARLARIYFAEFMRLFEHYRARAAWNRRQAGDKTTFRLDPDTGWAAQAFQPGTPEYKARVNMASPLPGTPA
jgi:hypothetical protein